MATLRSVLEGDAMVIVIRAWKDDEAVKIRLVTSYPGGSTTVTTTDQDVVMKRVKAFLDGLS